MRNIVLSMALLAACDGGGNLPLAVEVNDGVAAGGKLDELELVVKTLPNTDVRFDSQTKNTGDHASETFTIAKSKLKLGTNTFNVEATQSSLFTNLSAKASGSWVAGPKGLLRFYAPSSGAFEADISCGGIMCGATTLKVTKDGQLPLEVESAATGLASIDGQKTNVSPMKRGAVTIDLTKKLGAMNVLKEDLSLPIVLEGDGATTDFLDVSGPVITTVAARVLANAAKGPVLFPGESAQAHGKPALLAVVGAPSSALLVVGKSGTYQDIDLVAVATPAEHFFGCGKSAGGPGILYRDLDVSVYDRRAGGVVATRKLLADRVPCPPTPTATVKGDVREDDMKRVLATVLAK